MEKEIEAKFLNVDHDTVRAQLRDLGAELVAKNHEHKRLILKQEPDPSHDGDYSWFRVRDEGDKTTLTYKHITGKTIHDVEELEIEVSDLDKTAQILEKAGLKRRAVQHNRRETWRLGDVDIMLDEWPHAPPFIEIEATSENKVKELALKLGFDWNDAVFGSADNMYEQHYDIEHGYEITGLPQLDFNTPLPPEIEAKRK